MRQYARTLFAIVAVLALLAGGAGMSTAAQGSGSLTVLDWAGFDAEEFWIDFKNANPDVDVTFEIGASDADILAKMMAGSQADVFHPYTGWLQFYVDEGLVEEIDTSRLTNWDKVPDASRSSASSTASSTSSPGTGATARSSTGPTGSRRRVESWAALLDPEYSGHISMWDDGVAARSTSPRYIHGWDETNLTDEQLEQIKQEWIDAARAQPLLLVGRAGAGRGDGLRRRLGRLCLAGRLRAAAGRRACRSPTPTRRKAATPGSAYYGIRKGTENLDTALRLPRRQAGRGDRAATSSSCSTTAPPTRTSWTPSPTRAERGAARSTTRQCSTAPTSRPNLTAEQRDAWAEMWVDVKAS